MSASPTAPLDIVSAYAARLDDDMLQCRARTQHRWNPLSSDVTEKDGRLYETVECLACEAVSTVIIDAHTGEALGTRTRYSDGYLLKGHGRMSRRGKGILRLERYRRMGALR